MCRDRADKRGLTISFHQSNSEAQIIDWIHGGINGADGIIINPAAFTHTSVAILDALNMVKAADHRAAHLEPAQARGVPPPLLRHARRHRADLRPRRQRLSPCGRRDGGSARGQKAAAIMSAFEHILVEREGGDPLDHDRSPGRAERAEPAGASRAVGGARPLRGRSRAARRRDHRRRRARVLRRQRPQGARRSANADDHPPTGFGGISHRFDLPKPVIAAVNGLALGGGVEIVAACDLAIAADHAEFALPEPRVGLAALGGGGLQRLARTCR